MNPNISLRSFSIGLGLLGLSACATPEALRGDFPAVTPRDAQLSAPNTSAPLRWGGTLLSTRNKQDQSCFEILARPLDVSGRPKRTDEDLGRFLACTPGYREPEIYKAGRVITVVGHFAGLEERKIGEFPYRYPKLEADTVHLWTERDTGTTVIYTYDPFFSPWTYPYPYYYGGPTYIIQPAPTTNDATVIPQAAPRMLQRSPRQGADPPAAPKATLPRLLGR